MPIHDISIMNPQLYFIAYGKSPCPKNLLLSDAGAGETVEIVWGFYLLMLDGRNILIDTGFNDAALAKKFNIEMTDPLPILAEFGVDAASVKDIVITHHHFDHTGNIPRFPRARVIIQREAYDLYRKELPEHPEVASSQLRRFEEEYDLENILYLRKIGGHVPGGAEVSFIRKGKTYIFPGDECYLLDNYRLRTPVGFAENPEVNRGYVENLPEGIVLLPFHDPALLKEYPGCGEGAVRII